jgi:putative endonuclease
MTDRHPIPINLNVAVAKPFHVYILASCRNGTLYIGMTDNLIQRVQQHRDETFKGFTADYGVKTLVWFEPHATRADAFARERRLKKWNRAWKLRLIEQTNPQWRDLFETLS